MSTVIDKAKELGSDAYNKANEMASSADNATGNFFSRNKGFVIGALVALTALFGMDSGSSGMVPMLFSLAALAVGIFVDKDTGIFSGLFGGNKAHAAGNEMGKTRELDTAPNPTVAVGIAPEKKVEVNVTGDTSFMIDKDGKKVPPEKEPGVGVMLVKTNSEGKIVELAIAGSDGKFALNADTSIKTELVASKGINIKLELKKDSENKSYIDLEDAKTKDALNTARNTISNMKDIPIVPKGMSFKFEDQSLRNDLPTQTVGGAPRKLDASIDI